MNRLQSHNILLPKPKIQNCSQHLFFSFLSGPGLFYTDFHIIINSLKMFFKRWWEVFEIKSWFDQIFLVFYYDLGETLKGRISQFWIICHYFFFFCSLLTDIYFNYFFFSQIRVCCLKIYMQTLNKAYHI